jgi:RNA polymerase sigma-70 factor (ECF subfamily)
VHRIRHTYEPGRPVKPWLAAIVARRSIDALRKRGRVAAREVHNEPAYETYADPGANEGDAAHHAGELARMTRSLSKGQKEALDLVKLKEMSLAEASQASGQSVASLKVNIHRALKKLRLNLSKDQGRMNVRPVEELIDALAAVARPVTPLPNRCALPGDARLARVVAAAAI